MKRKRIDRQLLKQNFPDDWRLFLNEYVKFYQNLNDWKKTEFEKRIKFFLASKRIVPIDTEIDADVKLMVAVSALIPMFEFPEYNYPHLREVLIYPNSFDEKFRTERYWGHEENVVGMVGNRFMNSTMILSKPDLIRPYDGEYHSSNVGIHEFVHLIDKIDGEVDGIPEILIRGDDIKVWLELIETEKYLIETSVSDINSYALKSNAEFLAVISEYFFGAPERFKAYHPDLYQFLYRIYRKDH